MFLQNAWRRSVAFVCEGLRTIRSSYSSAESRSLYIAVASGAMNLVLGLGKIVSGILSLSMFTCVNGGYTLGMVFARGCALAGSLYPNDQQKQYRYYRRAGVVLLAGSLLYLAYSGWFYFHPKYTAYPKSVALAIATFTFTEITLNVRGILIYRKKRTHLLHALKTINLATSLITLVLTQSAILSFAQGGYYNPASNALLGLLTGTCAALLGIFMLWRIDHIEKANKNEKEGSLNDPYSRGRR